jgi:3-oxoadipate enol-lactonase
MTFANINGNTIHYEYLSSPSVGQGATFVFINSLGTDFRIWDGVVNTLKGYGNVLRYDKAGHGLSSDLRFGDLRTTIEPQETNLKSYIVNHKSKIANYADDVISLMDKLNIQKAVIVGLSIGGIIGQYLAVHHAERIEKLILSNTAPKVGSEESWNTRINIVQNKGITAIGDTVMKVWFSENFRQNRLEELAGCKAMLVNTNPQGYVQACEALKINDLTDQIHKINVPTLCIAGTEDGSTPPAQVKAMADQIPNAQYILIEGVGHIPCIEVPELIAKHILDFVK